MSIEENRYEYLDPTETAHDGSIYDFTGLFEDMKGRRRQEDLKILDDLRYDILNQFNHQASSFDLTKALEEDRDLIGIRYRLVLEALEDAGFVIKTTEDIPCHDYIDFDASFYREQGSD